MSKVEREKTSERVRIFSRVKYEDLDLKMEDQKIIIPQDQRDRYPDHQQFVADTSPLGKALMYKQEGDTVKVECPEPYNVVILEIDNSKDFLDRS